MRNHDRKQQSQNPFQHVAISSRRSDCLARSFATWLVCQQRYGEGAVKQKAAEVISDLRASDGGDVKTATEKQNDQIENLIPLLRNKAAELFSEDEFLSGGELLSVDEFLAEGPRSGQGSSNSGTNYLQNFLNEYTSWKQSPDQYANNSAYCFRDPVFIEQFKKVQNLSETDRNRQLKDFWEEQDGYEAYAEIIRGKEGSSRFLDADILGYFKKKYRISFKVYLLDKTGAYIEKPMSLSSQDQPTVHLAHVNLSEVQKTKREDIDFKKLNSRANHFELLLPQGENFQNITLRNQLTPNHSAKTSQDWRANKNKAAAQRFGLNKEQAEKYRTAFEEKKSEQNLSPEWKEGYALSHVILPSKAQKEPKIDCNKFAKVFEARKVEAAKKGHEDKSDIIAVARHWLDTVTVKENAYLFHGQNFKADDIKQNYARVIQVVDLLTQEKGGIGKTFPEAYHIEFSKKPQLFVDLAAQMEHDKRFAAVARQTNVKHRPSSEKLYAGSFEFTKACDPRSQQPPETLGTIEYSIQKPVAAAEEFSFSLNCKKEDRFECYQKLAATWIKLYPNQNSVTIEEFKPRDAKHIFTQAFAQQGIKVIINDSSDGLSFHGNGGGRHRLFVDQSLSGSRKEPKTPDSQGRDQKVPTFSGG